MGEVTFVARGEMPLKGFALPLAELSPPYRLAEKYPRGDSALLFSLPMLLELVVVRESLLEL